MILIFLFNISNKLNYYTFCFYFKTKTLILITNYNLNANIYNKL